MIDFNEKERVFSLHTAKSTYQMQVRDGKLIHLYYGKKVDQVQKVEVNRHDKGCWPNILPQEFPCFGLGDNHQPFFDLEFKDGSRAVDLKYASYEILPDKQKLPSLPHFFSADESLQIKLLDKRGVELSLIYSIFEDCDMITRSVCIRNISEDRLVLHGMPSAVFDFYGKQEMDFITFDGSWADERNFYRSRIRPGVQSIASVTGLSSHEHNPVTIICDSETNERKGNCYGFALVYSGCFKIQVEKSFAKIRLGAGISPDTFSWNLEKGESFYTPEIASTFSSSGFAGLRLLNHRAVKKHLLRNKWKNLKLRRPVLINSWEAFYFDFDENKLLDLAERAKEIGADLFVLDDGWFGRRNSDDGSLADWFVNEDKLRGGLSSLVGKINDLGMDFGIWFEPEAVSPNSDFYRKNSDCAFEIKDVETLKIRNQFTLDFINERIREKIWRQMTAVLDSCSVKYIKWDMNRAFANVYSSSLPSDRQGEIYHRYVLAVYDFQEKLINRYKDLLLENCAGGGGRFDMGMLYYSPQIWCSDNTDAYDRLNIQYGTSFFYPQSVIGAHFSACPNHITGRNSSVEARMASALMGTFGYELNLIDYRETDIEYLKVFTDFYRKHETVLREGNLIYLHEPLDSGKTSDLVKYLENNQYVQKREKGAVFMITYNDFSEMILFAVGEVLDGRTIKLPFTLPDSEYTMNVIKTGERPSYSGTSSRDLNEKGFVLPKIDDEFPGFICSFEKVLQAGLTGESRGGV